MRHFWLARIRRAVDDSIRSTLSGTELGFNLDAASMMSLKEPKTLVATLGFLSRGPNFGTTNWVPRRYGAPVTKKRTHYTSSSTGLPPYCPWQTGTVALLLIY
jgi:hypothetical protein